MAPRNPLSQVPPEEFVKARDALARQLRERGENDEAKRVAALRRPNTALWVTNQLGGRAAKDVEALIDSTARARKAQLHGGTEALRDAMHGQREALHRLMAEAHKSAAEIGATLTPDLQRRIQDTLQTAATSAPDALRQGAIEHEMSAAGFGALLPGAAAPASKAETRKAAFDDHREHQKRLLAEKRERFQRQREAQRAQQTSRRLAVRAEQLEHIARQAQLAAERAKEKAQEARRAAEESAARLRNRREG
jgi:transcription initiation factor TFIIIB Brf1 subunit/transcription initiation factor TFIIB